MKSIQSIHVNPKFKNAHINPNFLKRNEIVLRTPQIHVNPNFIRPSPSPKPEPLPLAPLLHTLRKIVRKPQNEQPIAKIARLTKAEGSNNLMKIGKNKLVRIKPQESNIMKNKFDNKTIVRKHFLCRSSLAQTKSTGSLVKALVKPKYRSIPVVKTTQKNVKLLSINGILYKSSTTKLEKSTRFTTKSSATIRSSNYKAPVNKTGSFIFVRGEKFILESNGKRLKRIDNDKQFKKSRIDIGGLTYIAKSGGETYEQTGFHTSRTHLSIAKNKSIYMLAKKYFKSNVPCSIFQRLGKCLGFERGRCNKVHDKKHVIICPKQLKGECDNMKCTLSHEINLSKMPTCKFFLQGCCSKIDCPYLHKKLNDNVEICENFKNGFCELAEKCTKRHERANTAVAVNKKCPWFQKRGACLDKKCKYVHEKRNTKPKAVNLNSSTQLSESTRYFITLTDDDANLSPNSENKQIIVKRSNLSSLPSFIPL